MVCQPESSHEFIRNTGPLKTAARLARRRAGFHDAFGSLPALRVSDLWFFLNMYDAKQLCSLAL